MIIRIYRGNDVRRIITFLYDIEELKNPEIISKTLPLKPLLSSELDIDRMDYLLRDAYFTGVTYGLYDFNRLYMMMEYHEKLNRLMPLEKGLSAVEGYLVARRHMYYSVYLHKTTIGAELLLASIFKRVKDSVDDNKISEKDFLFRELYYLVSDDFIPNVKINVRIVDYMVLSQIYEWTKHNDNILRDLCNRFIHRKLLKSIFLGREQVEMYNKCTENMINKAYNRVMKLGYDPEYYFLIYRDKIPGYSKYPVKEKSLEESSAISIKMRDGSWEDITNLSEIVRSLLETVNIIEIYVPEKIRSDVRSVFI